jgi:penicillin-binding protein 2
VQRDGNGLLMKKKRKLISSMFHRRLLLLSAAMFIVVCGLCVQMVRLSVVEAAEHRAEAESRLDRVRFLPTIRGKILDCKGRVLAEDVPSDDIAVEYSVITGAWAYDNAARIAKRAAGKKWPQMSPEAREAAIQRELPAQRETINHIWTELEILGRITREELDQRLDAIKRDVHSLRAEVWDRQRRAEMLRYGESAAATFEPGPIREERMAHVILPRVSQDVVFEARRLERDFPGMIEVQQSTKRQYPWLVADVWIDRTSLPPSDAARQPLQMRLAGVADHIIGAMRHQVFAEDVERRPFLVDVEAREYDLKGYRSFGDTVGGRGLELVFEDRLRGTRGMVRQRIDTGEEERTDPVPGRDLQLTLDVQLQARAQAILSTELGLTTVQPWHEHPILEVGTPLNAAVVVVDVETGEILAMVSMPTLGMAEQMTPGRVDRDQPFINRAVEAIYPPGSILKPFVLAAAIGESKFGLAESIACTGHYFPDKQDVARCWIYREQYGFATHAPLQAEEAIARSCNIFFYTIAERTGIHELAAWFSTFGLGRGLDVGLRHPRIVRRNVEVSTDDVGETGELDALSSEGASDLPGLTDDETSRVASKLQSGELKEEVSLIWVGESAGTLIAEEEIARMPLYERTFETISMGIGQGRVTWTPVQAANAYAMLARGGVVRDATLVMHDQRTRSASLRQPAALAPRTVATILEGLRQSVEEPYGTGHNIKLLHEPIINAPGVTVWAKTGTAQAPPGYLIDTNNDGRIVRDRNDPAHDTPITELDHSWFVGLVGPKQSAGQRAQPKYAIAVVVEYGGSGGRVAGPVANQIIHALQAEGYLPNPNADLASQGTLEDVQ